MDLPDVETEIDTSKDFGRDTCEVVLRLAHPGGEVNRARYMPQNPFVIATKSPSADVLVFDVSKHPSMPEENSPCTPQFRCTGHEKEGYGLSWSTLKEWHLLSGSDDCNVCFWDLRDAKTSAGKKGESMSVPATATRKGHGCDCG